MTFFGHDTINVGMICWIEKWEKSGLSFWICLFYVYSGSDPSSEIGPPVNLEFKYGPGP